VFVVATLAAWRATSLVTTDTISDRFRRRLIKRFPARVVPLYDPNGDEVAGTGQLKKRLLVELVHCDRCLGFWMSAGAFGLAHGIGLAPSWKLCLLAWPAGAAVITGLSDHV